jgi:hypothetical protein
LRSRHTAIPSRASPPCNTIWPQFRVTRWIEIEHAASPSAISYFVAHCRERCIITPDRHRHEPAFARRLRLAGIFAVWSWLPLPVCLSPPEPPTPISKYSYPLCRYYVIVAACVLLRKNEQLREASLAAALVIPAISSLHGLVLSSYHVNGQFNHQPLQDGTLTPGILGAVDFDIFGAFQLCSIAMLAAPLTVRVSQTYFFAQGRNIIFLWTMLMVAGLISLCIEFYRVTTADCPSTASAKGFEYGDEMCGMICSEEEGPFSPMRGGSASNIYVVPVPSRLTFNAAMLLAAGICIPAILSLLFTADKILEVNWKRRKGAQQPEDQVEGGNITVRELNNINTVVTKFLSVIEIPVFGGAVLAIIVIGELNFFSTPLMYQTEPMASIGKPSWLRFVIESRLMFVPFRTMVAHCRYLFSRSRFIAGLRYKRQALEKRYVGSFAMWP